jgi:hypothetical protein
VSKLLINESPLVILPSLAVQIGLNEAIVLQQLHYWLHHAKTHHDGKKWVYKTVDEWKSEFPFWGDSTIKRAFASLRQRDLVLIQQLSRIKSDHTNYYTINYETLEMMPVQNEQAAGQIEQALGQNEQILDGVKMTLSSIPENTNKITTEKATPKSSKIDPLAIDLPPNIKPELWAEFVAMRRDTKKPVTTQSAIKGLLNQLAKCADANASLQQSIDHCWQGVFEVKPSFNQPAFKPAFGQVATRAEPVAPQMPSATPAPKTKTTNAKADAAAFLASMGK